MRILGVLDLMGGRAVHARGGNREQYTAVQRAGGVAIDGDAVALAATYVEKFGIEELYAADLDAIASGALQAPLARSIAGQAPLWLDGGVSSPQAAYQVIDTGAARVIVGLETLSSFDALAAVCDALGSERVAFSLDLRHGAPVARGALADGATAREMARRAASAGAGAIVVVDLARVGAAGGMDFDLIARVRDAAPAAMLLAGGGVRSVDDLSRLAAAGCDGALVATAIHDGGLSRADLAAARRLQRSASR